jgi:hypothetical protein
MSDVKLPEVVAKKYTLVGASTPRVILSEKHGRKVIDWDILTLAQADELIKLPGFKYLKENKIPGPAPKD